MAAGEALEGVVDAVRVRVGADPGRDEGPTRVDGLAVAVDNIVLDVV